MMRVGMDPGHEPREPTQQKPFRRFNTGSGGKKKG